MSLPEPIRHTALSRTYKTQKKELFERLVTCQSNDRYRCMLCGDTVVAEDLVQGTMMRAWRAIDKLFDPSAAKSWWFAILRRENFRRINKKSSQLTDDDGAAVSLDHNDNRSDLDSLTLQQILHKLPSTCSDPLVLQVLGG